MKQTVRATALIATAAIIILSITLLDGVPFIFGDAYCYYHVAKSIVTEGSFTSSDQPEYAKEHYDHNCSFQEDSTGEYITIVTPGNGISIAPFLLLASQFDAGSSFDNYYKAFNGHSLADGLAVLASGIVYAVSALLLWYGSLRKLKFSKKISALATGLVFLSSYAFSYIFELPGYSHIFEIFCLSALIYFGLDLGKRDARAYFGFLAGLFAGLLIMTRPPDILIAMPVLLYMIVSSPNRKRSIASILAGAMPMAFIFGLYNYVSYGSALSTGYTSYGSIILDFSQFYLFDLLFSGIRGWLVYSPIVVFSIVGSILLVRKDVRFSLLTIIPIALILLFYSFFPYWYGGHTYGQRFLLVLSPIISIGIAHLLYESRNWKAHLRTSLAVVLILCTGFSFGLTLLLRITPTQRLHEIIPNPHLSEDIPPSESFTISDIFEYHLFIAAESESARSYAETLAAGLQSGRSLILLAVGYSDPILRTEILDEDTFVIHLITNSSNKAFTTDLSLVMQNDNTETVYSIKDITVDEPHELTIACSTMTSCSIENKDVVLDPSPTMEDRKDIRADFCLENSVCVEISPSYEMKIINR